MPHDHDPLSRLLDTDRRSQVGGFRQGLGIVILVEDITTGQVVVMDVMSTLFPSWVRMGCCALRTLTV